MAACYLNVKGIDQFASHLLSKHGLLSAPYISWLASTPNHGVGVGLGAGRGWEIIEGRGWARGHDLGGHVDPLGSLPRGTCSIRGVGCGPCCDVGGGDDGLDHRFIGRREATHPPLHRLAKGLSWNDLN